MYIVLLVTDLICVANVICYLLLNGNAENLLVGLFWMNKKKHIDGRRKESLLTLHSVLPLWHGLTWMTRYLWGSRAMRVNSAASSLNLGRLSASIIQPKTCGCVSSWPALQKKKMHKEILMFLVAGPWLQVWTSLTSWVIIGSQLRGHQSECLYFQRCCQWYSTKVGGEVQQSLCLCVSWWWSRELLYI